MATVHIVNPTFAKSTKTLRERIGKYKHRPVYYSKSPGKLGERSEFKKLNPKKGSGTMAAKKTKKYRPKKKNPAGSKGTVKYRYRAKKTKRRNPDGVSSISATSVAFTLGGGLAGAVGYKVVTGLTNSEGNGKYIIAAVLALGGGWLLSKFYRPLAAPFAAGVAGAAGIEYLVENDVLAGLHGSTPQFTPQDINTLQLWNNGYDTGMNGAVPELMGATQQEMPGGIQLNNPAMYSAMAGNGGEKL